MSVIVPTRNRPERLVSTLERLLGQRGVEPTEYELIVVDDGSAPPITGDGLGAERDLKVLRLEGSGPSSARNAGANAARGELLVFVDDDMQVVPEFLASHWEAHAAWPSALQVGLNRLTESATARPFGRFRQELEDQVMPAEAGPVEAPNFCTAANMAIEREIFERLGGFDPSLSTGEDQDLALRHSDRGGEIVFVAAARAVHNDAAEGLSGYLRRAEIYMEELVRFGEHHPEWPETAVRARVNGPVQIGGEPAALSAKKLLKSALIWPPVHIAALALVRLVEAVAPNSGLLERLYRALLGAHLQRGYRKGLRSESA